MALRKFSSQLQVEVFEEAQDLAQREGRHFQALLDEAVRHYLARRRQAPRGEVMRAYIQSLKEHEALYRALAQ